MKNKRKIILLCTVAAMLLAILLCLALPRIPALLAARRLREAAALLRAGDRQEAYALLEAMEDSDEAAALLEEARLNEAETLLNDDKQAAAAILLQMPQSERARELLDAPGMLEAALRGLCVPGNTVFLGLFQNEPVLWRVLDRDDSSALLISENVLDARCWNDVYAEVRWEDCTLREWLQTDFLRDTFSAAELDLLLPVSADGDPVTLPDTDDTYRYFAGDTDRQAKPTAYAVSRGVSVTRFGNSWWWLRDSAPSTLTRASVMRDGGAAYAHGTYVDHENGGVRPMIRVSLQDAK